MAVNFPDVGPNRRWNVQENELRIRYFPSLFDQEPYELRLEEFVPARTVYDLVETWVGWSLFRLGRYETIKKERLVSETWETIDKTYIDDLETDTLLEAATRVLARVDKVEWEKSRLGTYPPKTLEN